MSRRRGKERRGGLRVGKREIQVAFFTLDRPGVTSSRPPQSRLAVGMQVCSAIQVDTASLEAHSCSS